MVFCNCQNPCFLIDHEEQSSRGSKSPVRPLPTKRKSSTSKKSSTKAKKKQKKEVLSSTEDSSSDTDDSDDFSLRVGQYGISNLTSVTTSESDTVDEFMPGSMNSSRLFSKKFLKF